LGSWCGEAVASSRRAKRLARQLKHRSWRKRWSAVKQFKKMGRRGVRAIPALVRALHDKHYLVRTGAADALGGMGRSAVNPLRWTLRRAKDWKARMYAAKALGKIGPKAKAAIPDLKRALRDPKDSVRKHARLSLGQIRGGGSSRGNVAAMIRKFRRMKDPSNERSALAMKLVKSGARPSVILPHLLRALQNDLMCTTGPGAVSDAIAKLGAKAIKGLARLLRHRKSLVRCAAVVTLGETRSKRAIPYLVRMFTDKGDGITYGTFDNRGNPSGTTTRTVGQHAADAVGRIGPKAISSMLRLLRHRNALIRANAARALGAMGRKARRAKAAVRRLRRDRSPKVRRAVKEALKQM